MRIDVSFWGDLTDRSFAASDDLSVTEVAKSLQRFLGDALYSQVQVFKIGGTPYIKRFLNDH